MCVVSDAIARFADLPAFALGERSEERGLVDDFPLARDLESSGSDVDVARDLHCMIPVSVMDSGQRLWTICSIREVVSVPIDDVENARSNSIVVFLVVYENF